MPVDIDKLIGDANRRLSTLSGEPPDLTTESGASPSTMEFFSAPVERGQRQNYKAARTEVRRTGRELRRAGIDVDAALEEAEPGTFSTLTQPIFDMLQIGQFVTAGAAIEIARNGLGWEAFKRAAAEFSNALPGIEITDNVELTAPFLGTTKLTKPDWLPKAERPSFSTLLKENPKLLEYVPGKQIIFDNLFDEEGADKWSAAIGGFVLDVVLDPITYTGFGLAGKVPRGIRAALDIGEKTPLIGSAVKKGRDVAGEAFKAGYDKIKWGRGAGAEANVAKVMEEQRLAEVGYQQASAEIHDAWLKIGAGMTIPERRLIGAFFRRPEQLDGVLKSVATDAEHLAELKSKVQAGRDVFEQYAKEGVDEGLLDEMVVAAQGGTYVPGMVPKSAGSEKAMEDLFDKLGVDEARRIGPNRTGTGKLVGQGTPGYTKPKTHYDTLERIAAAVPTELDFISLGVRRGLASARYRASRRFADAVLSDPAVATRIGDSELVEMALKSEDELVDLAKGGDALAVEAVSWKDAMKAKGYGIYRPMRRNLSDEGVDITTLKKNDVFHSDGLRKTVVDRSRPAILRDVPDPITEQVIAADLKKGSGVMINDKLHIVDTLDRGKGVRVKNLTTGKVTTMEVNEGVVPLVGQKVSKDAVALETITKGRRFRTTDGESFKVVQRGRRAKVRARDAKTNKMSDVRPDLEVNRVVEEPTLTVRDAKGNTELLRPMKEMSTVQKYVGEPAFMLPEPFIKDLTVADNIMRGKSDAQKFFDKAVTLQNVWKGYAIMSPGFHARNMYSNWFNNYLGGVNNPASYIDALRLQIGASKAGVGDAVSVTLKGGEKLSGQQIIKLAKDHGVYNGIFHSDIPLEMEQMVLSRLWNTGGSARKTTEIADRLRKMGGEELLNIDGRSFGAGEVAALIAETSPKATAGQVASRIAGQASPQMRLNRAMGSAVENNARLAHFVHQLRKGMDPTEASASVRKYLFDYSELTEFEQKYMKRMLPFYTWSRKNVPLMMQEVLENPAKFSRISAKPIQAIESLSEDFKDVPAPDYFQELHAVRLPKGFAQAFASINGVAAEAAGVGPNIPEGEVQPVFLNPNVPFQDLNRMNWKDLVSGASPFLKLPIEMATGTQNKGYSFFLDREIERYPGEPAEIDLLGTGYRPSKKTEYAIRTLFPTVGKVERIRQRASQGQIAAQLSTELLGIKVMQVDIDRVNRSKTYKSREVLRGLKQKARELGVIR